MCLAEKHPAALSIPFAKLSGGLGGIVSVLDSDASKPAG